MTDALDRRRFLKVLGVTGAGAAAASCGIGPEPTERLIPYLVQPEDQVPGVATYYATTCRECAAGCGVRVRVREGRAVKLEGNPDSPINRGRLCARGQAALQGLYNPDRISHPLVWNASGTFEAIDWDGALLRLSAKVREARGKGIVFLTGAGQSRVDGQVRVRRPASVAHGHERRRVDRGAARYGRDAGAGDGAGHHEPAPRSRAGRRQPARQRAGRASTQRRRPGNRDRRGNDRPARARVCAVGWWARRRGRDGDAGREWRGYGGRGEHPELRRRSGGDARQVRRGPGHWLDQLVRRAGNAHVRHGGGPGGPALCPRHEPGALAARCVPAGARQGRVQGQLLVVPGRDGGRLRPDPARPPPPRAMGRQPAAGRHHGVAAAGGAAGVRYAAHRRRHSQARGQGWDIRGVFQGKGWSESPEQRRSVLAREARAWWYLRHRADARRASGYGFVRGRSLA